MAIMRLEGLGQLKISDDLIGNRNRNLPVCSIVPQSTTLLRVRLVRDVARWKWIYPWGDGRITLKYIWKEKNVRVRSGYIWHRVGITGGLCEYSNENSGSLIQDNILPRWVRNILSKRIQFHEVKNLTELNLWLSQRWLRGLLHVWLWRCVLGYNFYLPPSYWWFLLGLRFVPEDGSSMLIRNFNKLLPNCTALHLRSQSSSYLIKVSCLLCLMAENTTNPIKPCGWELDHTEKQSVVALYNKRRSIRNTTAIQSYRARRLQI
jgi:hypothetical protein